MEAGETTQQGRYYSKNNSTGSSWCLFLSQNILDDRNYQPQGISEAPDTQDDSVALSNELGIGSQEDKSKKFAGLQLHRALAVPLCVLGIP